MPLDLRRLKATDAARKLYEWVCARSREVGQNPDVEVAIMSPAESVARGFPRAWRVVWESGPPDWGVHLTLGESYLASSVIYRQARAEVALVGSRLWLAEPHYTFDVAFFSEEAAAR
jgi:hypothetical protein